MDDHVFQIRMPRRFWSRRWLFMIGVVASLFLVFFSFTLPYRSTLSPSLPSLEKEEILSSESTSYVIKRLGMLSLLGDTHNSTYLTVVPKDPKDLDSAEINNVSGRSGRDFRDKQVDFVSDFLPANISDLKEDIDLNKDISLDVEERENLRNVGDQIKWSITEEKNVDQNDIASDQMAKEAVSDFSFTFKNATNVWSQNKQVFHDEVITLAKGAISSNGGYMKKELVVNSSSHVAMSSALVFSLSEREEHASDANLTEHHMMGTHLTNITLLPLSGSSASSAFDYKQNNIRFRSKKLGRNPVSVSKMKQLLLTYYSSYQQKIAHRLSARDKQLLVAKALLQKVPVLKNDEELYGAAFWNISEFKRSYELMERMLKIYVYKEGSKPVFHQPLLRGIYASEGWLMKLLQTDKRFVVRDHRKANLFYLPFSSRLLQLSFYVHNSHSHRNLAQHLKNYVDIISAKYPYWNRTGGADHFLAACHDWAPHITGQAMEASIRALCNADLKRGFQLGKDVSLPEIYIRSARNPLRDLGGNPADNRSTLAFYAGNLHGSLRPILLQHWENKEPDMKILGPMPPGVESKMVYIEHMKTSKYCICPRGYEVNSPRVVESIYYECVPVIISDNYVPPFLEMLNWEAFSVIILEEDVPRLKDILVEIPEEKYRLLQLGVRKVQQHFLWHNKPVKYDLFHMILHSIWYNRLHQVRSS